jgi:hypothetical protein
MMTSAPVSGTLSRLATPSACDFQARSRLSRIHYNGAFFDYPLRPINALRGLGPTEALRIMASYIRARTYPTLDEKSFEE